ncbi:MAG: acyl carrier protein [Burkholderiaceae bacterium]|nr:acyl carrier protein [Burkholderiaceae bacterium]
MSPLENEIAQIILNCTGIEDITVEEIDADAPLFGDGLGLDSIDALEIGVALNKRYGVKLSADDDDTRKHFANLRSLAGLVEAQRTT